MRVAYSEPARGHKGCEIRLGVASWKRHTLAALALVVMGMAGCVWTPHQVDLTAVPQRVGESKIGEGARIKVVVIDDRDQRVVGQRGVGAVGSDISSPQLLTHLERQVKRGFQDRGFVVVPDNEHAKVTVFLRSFKWDTQMGFWTGGENVFVSIRADARNAMTKEEMVKTYHYDDERRVLVVAFGDEISKRMNAGLTGVLDQLFSDDVLMRFLVAASRQVTILTSDRSYMVRFKSRV